METTKQDLVILGGGDFAKKVSRLARSDGRFNILGFTSPDPSDTVFDLPRLGPDEILKDIIRSHPGCGAVLGFAGNMKLRDFREKLITWLKELGFIFPVIVAKDALVDETVKMDEGVLIFNRAIVDFNTEVGAFSVINLISLIGHDVKIGRNSVISPMGMIGGGTKIGDNCFTGMNATINPYLEIGNNVIIGAASMVVKNCHEAGTYVGNPVQKVK
jgi:acetyltransferase EpsM